MPKRSLTPSHSLESLENVIERELASEMKSFSEFPESDQKRVETALRTQIRGKMGNKYERDYFKRKAEAFRSDKENLLSKLRLAHSKLNTRSYLEHLLHEVVPLWIVNLKSIPPRDKLSVSFLFQLTVAAKALFMRRTALKIEVDWKDIGNSLSVLYDAFSRRVNYNRSVPVCLTDTEWDILFDGVNIYHASHKIIIKKMLEPIDEQELENVKRQGVTYTYALYVKGLDIDINGDGEYNTSQKIKQYSGPLGDKLSDFYYPVNVKKEYTNEVFINTRIISMDELETLKKLLLMYKKSGTESVFIRNNFIHPSTMMETSSQNYFTNPSSSSTSGEHRPEDPISRSRESDGHRRSKSPRKSKRSRSHSSDRHYESKSSYKSKRSRSRSSDRYHSSKYSRGYTRH